MNVTACGKGRQNMRTILPGRRRCPQVRGPDKGGSTVLVNHNQTLYTFPTPQMFASNLIDLGYWKADKVNTPEPPTTEDDSTAAAVCIDLQNCIEMHTKLIFVSLNSICKVSSNCCTQLKDSGKFKCLLITMRWHHSFKMTADYALSFDQA